MTFILTAFSNEAQDNYIMIIGAVAKTFKANETEIDLIWGSFEMWSGKS